MVSNSPLGQYAPLAATVASLGVIGAYVLALLFEALGLFPNGGAQDLDGLQNLALIAAGAVFGSAVAVNGWKQPLASAHDRIDRLETAVNVEAATGAISTHEA